MKSDFANRRKCLWGYLCVLALTFAIAVPSAALFTGCQHQGYDESVKLQFSADTLLFDTVFTTVSSITRSFTVHNPSSDPVSLDVYLAGGDQSYYSINVDGMAGTEFHDVEIPARDSIFVFVKVTINPLNQNNPYLVTDSVMFCNKQRRQSVPLVAFGQDAHFVVAGSAGYALVAGAHEQVRWTNDKPWVIYGLAAVDSLGTLTIDPGTKIYGHHGSRLWIYAGGNLQVNGTQDNPVVFAGDRLESYYQTDYAQWDGIYICEGYRDNVIDYAVIKNAAIGLQLTILNEAAHNKVKVNNTVIQNCSNIGVLARGIDLEMTNCQISNTGSYSMLLQVGDFTLNHVTIANYYAQSVRNDPAFLLTNYYSDNNYTWVGNTTLTCNNSIIYGNLSKNDVNESDEVKVYTDDAATLSYGFNNCLIKKAESDSHFRQCIFNHDPKFISIYGQDYNIESASPAIDAGKSGLGINIDLLGRARNGIPDIGAYEYYPAESKRR